MALDQTIQDQLTADVVRGMRRQSDSADQAARDTASLLLLDHRCISAALAREIAMAPNSQTFADLNASARTPNTPPAAAPGAPAGAAAAPVTPGH